MLPSLCGLWDGCEHTGLLLSAAGTQSCSGMGRQRDAVGLPSVCFCAGRVEGGKRLQRCALYGFVPREDTLLRTALASLLVSSSRQGTRGRGHACRVEAAGRGSGPKPGLGLALLSNKLLLHLLQI